MKIYTRLGDKGETSLIGGKRIAKYHVRIDAYGMVDELIANIAVLRDSEIETPDNEFLLQIQHRLMNCTALLAKDPENKETDVPGISEDDILDLEKEIDRINVIIPQLKFFIIPGGDMASSRCHVARTVCRRAERKISELSEQEYVDELLKKYINRLSDYLFVLSRKIIYDKGGSEIKWMY